MDTIIAAQFAMRSLCEDAVQVLNKEGAEPQLYRGVSSLSDTARNERFQSLGTFSLAVSEVAKLPYFAARFGTERAGEVALQFVFTYIGALSSKSFDLEIFERVWDSLLKELSTSEWTYIAVSNLKNFSSNEVLLDLGDGITIRKRSYAELNHLLGWSHEYINLTLGKDWSEGSYGEYVLLVETKLEKTPDNLVLANDQHAYTKLGRALLALRLFKPGFIRIGRIFYARPAHFRFGLGGISSSGYSGWQPGAEYILHRSECGEVSELYNLLSSVEAKTSKYVRGLSLALRSFSSIYERHFHQWFGQFLTEKPIPA